ncbi:putative RNA-directed DNA polymerase from transposon BS [Labeo rohita]|uniref:RNA-directed DNA polymerase from transposon BS n=1 Tax=Labeo rohita TaxID=84645 RepID=A0ABQ8M4C9_LABRO|nr:putative RNA-directed DNA polymerase from transposon BS [Labeo rohita]
MIKLISPANCLNIDTLGLSHHGLVHLLPAYRQKCKSAKPVVRTVKRWTVKAEQDLQACFELTDWSVFEAAATDLDELTDTVTSYISFCEDMCVPTRTYLTFNNDKPWFSAKLKQLRQAKENAYRMWNGLKAITSYKSPSPSTEANQQLADDLNEFYCSHQHPPPPSPPTVSQAALKICEGDVCKVLRKQKIRKAKGPDGVSPACLKACAVQVSSIFTLIFNRSLELCIVPSCFKCSTIIPVPKKSKMTGLNDYRPVGLTSVVMKSFERLVLAYMKDSTGPLLDPLQLLTEQTDILQNKLSQLSVPTSICQWITSFLTDRQQVVRLGKLTSGTRTISTGAPQGCVLSPLLFSPCTNDCISKDPSVKLLKFADDTTVIGFIQDGDESAYRQEVKQVSLWCSHNNLELNTLKIVEMTVDFRRNPPALTPLTIMNSTVAAVDSFKFIGTNISQDLNSVLFWFGAASKSDIGRLQRTVRTAERIIGVHLPNLQDLYNSRVKKRAENIIKDPSHPGHNLNLMDLETHSPVSELGYGTVSYNRMTKSKSAGDGCLATADATEAQTTERFGKKEKSVRLAFSTRF